MSRRGPDLTRGTADRERRHAPKCARLLRGANGSRVATILVAVGRTATPPGSCLEEAGVELDNRGYVRVTERLETTASDVWAIGECAGSRSSRTHPSTTSGSSKRISPAATAPHAIG